MDEARAACVACQANRGEIPTPGGVIYQDGLWRLEHAFEPIPMVGWLILKPLRHVESLSELTHAEAQSLGGLIQRISAAMTEELRPVKVYVACFAETVAHLHFHFIPRSEDAPVDKRGPDIFHYLGEAGREKRNLGDVREAARVAMAIRGALARDG
jgi:diadenosine tetraphosphate (Ap4A) HIT family hydrolase